MKLLGLDLPRISHRDAMRDVLAAAAVVVGFGVGAALLGNPIDRAGAVALFVGCLYAFMADAFVVGQEGRGRRFGLVAAGAGTLIALAWVLEANGVL